MTRPSQETLNLFQTLVELVAKLRSPEGCPWDKQQTQKSLASYAIEEAYELAEAIETGNQEAICSELGDFLFQVILQAQVASEDNLFQLSDVLSSLNEKMLRRHPHVFGEKSDLSLEQIWSKWEKIKSTESANKAEKSRTPFQFPEKLPALQTSAKIGRKTANWKFDWENIQDVLAKVKEEIFELEQEIQKLSAEDLKTLSPKSTHLTNLEHEVGDVLFSTAQLSRHLSLDPESALRQANLRFQNRFVKMLELSQCQSPEIFAQLSNKEKNDLWEQAKKIVADKNKIEPTKG